MHNTFTLRATPIRRALIRATAVLTLVLAFSLPAFADQVLLKNGDRLTGKIVKLEAGSLTIDTELAGTVVISFDNISTFSSDETLSVHLQDGSVLKERVQATDRPGTFQITGGDLVDQTVTMDKVKAINPRAVQWDGSILFGADIDAGNTQETEYDVKLEATRRSEYDRILLLGSYAGERTKSSGDWTTTKREVHVSLQYDYFLGNDWYAWGATSAEKDGTADLDLRLITGVGGGYEWVNDDKTVFDTLAGVTWVSENYSDFTDDDDYIAGRVGTKFSRKITSHLSFFNNINWIPSFEDGKDQYVTAIAGVKNTFTSSLFAEVSVEYEWDSTPADTAKRTDTTYLIGVGYSF